MAGGAVMAAGAAMALRPRHSMRAGEAVMSADIEAGFGRRSVLAALPLLAAPLAASADDSSDRHFRTSADQSGVMDRASPSAACRHSP